jgi:hypothetical protein
VDNKLSLLDKAKLAKEASVFEKHPKWVILRFCLHIALGFCTGWFWLAPNVDTNGFTAYSFLPLLWVLLFVILNIMPLLKVNETVGN